MANDKQRISQKGSRIGWLAGWAGGFLWVVVIAIVKLAQGEATVALCGIALTVMAFAGIWCLRPWKYPDVRIWKLMVPLYLVFLLAIPWAVWTFGGLEHSDLNWWMFLWLLPCMTPFWTIGVRLWNDIHRSDATDLSHESQEDVKQ